MNHIIKRYLFVIVLALLLAFLFGQYDTFTRGLHNALPSIRFLGISTVLTTIYFIVLFTIEYIELIKVLSKKWLVQLKQITLNVKEKNEYIKYSTIFEVVISHLKLNVVRC